MEGVRYNGWLAGKPSPLAIAAGDVSDPHVGRVPDVEMAREAAASSRIIKKKVLCVVEGMGNQQCDLQPWFQSRVYGDTFLLHTRLSPQEEHIQLCRGMIFSAAG